MSSLSHFKSEGDACLRRHEDARAFLHYTQALAIDPDDVHCLYQRSKAFMRQQQFHFALKDAEQLSVHKEMWVREKGFQRMAEVFTATEQWSEALEAYQKAFQVSSQEKELFMEGVRRSRRLMNKDELLTNRFPFFGLALSLLIALCVLSMDSLMNEKPFVTNNALKLFIVLNVAFVGFVGAKNYRRFVLQTRRDRIRPPVDLFNVLSTGQ